MAELRRLCRLLALALGRRAPVARVTDGVADREPIAPPVLCQHTDEVLREWLGLDDAAIAALRAQTVV